VPFSRPASSARWRWPRSVRPLMQDMGRGPGRSRISSPRGTPCSPQRRRASPRGVRTTRRPAARPPAVVPGPTGGGGRADPPRRPTASSAMAGSRSTPRGIRWPNWLGRARHSVLVASDPAELCARLSDGPARAARKVGPIHRTVWRTGFAGLKVRGVQSPEANGRTPAARPGAGNRRGTGRKLASNGGAGETHRRKARRVST
jgi:hypothetical protein